MVNLNRQLHRLSPSAFTRTRRLAKFAIHLALMWAWRPRGFGVAWAWVWPPHTTSQPIANFAKRLVLVKALGEKRCVCLFRFTTQNVRSKIHRLKCPLGFFAETRLSVPIHHRKCPLQNLPAKMSAGVRKLSKTRKLMSADTADGEWTVSY